MLELQQDDVSLPQDSDQTFQTAGLEGCLSHCEMAAEA